jgi:hypothetical protein
MTTRMKKFLQLALAASGLTALAAGAWPYQDGDVLLIFRESGYNDVEFDLGNVGQFLHPPNGSSAVVTNWDLALVTNTFGGDLTGVSVILAATESWTNTIKTAWLSGPLPNTTAYDVTPSAWQANLWSIINAIGTRPLIYKVPPAGPSSYSIDPAGTYAVASYDNIVSGDGVNTASLARLGGNAPFTVEQIVPGSFEFWGIQPSTTQPKPPDNLVGTFTITADGTLTFQAGPPPSTILGLTVSGGISSVSFTTTVGGQYWLAATNQLGPPVSQWPVVSGPLPGDGRNDSLTQTNLPANGFYSIIRTP